MKLKIYLTLSVILLVALACGPGGAVVTITPEPTFVRHSIPPTSKAGEFGHFEGQNPEISFDYTEKGVKRLDLNFRYESRGVKGFCLFSQMGTAEVDESGNFLIRSGPNGISGRIQGTTASGEWHVSQCGKGAWTAEFQEP